MHTVQVHLEQPTARARYAVSQVVERMLGWTVRFVDDAADLDDHAAPKLVYGSNRVAGAFHVVPAGLLEQQGRAPIEPPVGRLGGIPVLFPVDGGDLSFDPFAGAFFLLTRYEEWSEHPRDAHGRPLAEWSHAARHGYLELPVVDHWALQLAEAWRAQDPALPVPRRAYSHVVTVDMDNGYKYLGRPLWRTLGAWIRDIARGAWPDVMERGRVLLGTARDPFDIDPDLAALHPSVAQRVLVFILTADRSQWDHAVPVEDPRYAARLRSLARQVEVGIHPSYTSSEQPGTMARERDRLQRTIGASVQSSRQHFLRFALPGTLREVEQMGIAEEHSMGYHERIGFRAGTCTPYTWYDLSAERPTALVIHPFAVMDNTLRDKLGLSPDEAVARTVQLIEAVRRVQGTFTGLWHESFLAPTGPSVAWRAAILRILEAARP